MPLLEVRQPDDLDGVFAYAVKERAGGILVLPSAFFLSFSAHRPPGCPGEASPEHEEFAQAGGFLSYGPSHREMFRPLAAYVDKVLQRAKPADLPIEQPTKFDSVINLKTAKALGLTIPPSLLQRADR